MLKVSQSDKKYLIVWNYFSDDKLQKVIQNLIWNVTFHRISYFLKVRFDFDTIFFSNFFSSKWIQRECRRSRPYLHANNRWCYQQCIATVDITWWRRRRIETTRRNICKDFWILFLSNNAFSIDWSNFRHFW